MEIAKRIFQLAQETAESYDLFNARRMGSGEIYMREVVDQLKCLVVEEFGPGVANRFSSRESRLSVDFWIEAEQTIIVLEFGMLSSWPLLEKEAFKALLAQDGGKEVRNLVLIGDPGSVRRHQSPAVQAVMEWLERKHEIRVQIWELTETSPAGSV
jgi:hypothetical protein